MIKKTQIPVPNRLQTKNRTQSKVTKTNKKITFPGIPKTKQTIDVNSCLSQAVKTARKIYSQQLLLVPKSQPQTVVLLLALLERRKQIFRRLREFPYLFQCKLFPPNGFNPFIKSSPRKLTHTRTNTK